MKQFQSPNFFFLSMLIVSSTGCGGGFKMSLPSVNSERTNLSAYEKAQLISDQIDQTVEAGETGKVEGSVVNPTGRFADCGISTPNVTLEMPKSPAEHEGFLSASREQIESDLKALKEKLESEGNSNIDNSKLYELIADLDRKEENLNEDADYQEAFQRGQALFRQHKESLDKNMAQKQSLTDEQRQCLQKRSCEIMTEQKNQSVPNPSIKADFPELKDPRTGEIIQISKEELDKNLEILLRENCKEN